MEPLALIVAVAENGVIGRDGGMPWRLPDELRHFKRTTLGHCLIMGRKTWESLPGALPGRTSIVVTRSTDYRADEALVANDLDGAIALARERGDDEPVVAGGRALYEQALPLATRVWRTVVHAAVDGDVHFPDWETRGWQRTSADEHPADDRHPHAFTIEGWVRAGA